MPAEVYSLHGKAPSAPAKKRSLKYEKSAKRPVDSNAPKKPLSAYFQWAAENRKRVQEEEATSNIAAVTKKLGEMWRNLVKEDKVTWEQKYKKQNDIYKKLMGAYKLTSEHKNFEKSLHEYNVQQTYKPFKKDENMPKKAASAYMVFQSEKRSDIVKANPDAKVTEIMGLVGAAWKEVSEKDREVYKKKSKKLSEKASKDIAEHKVSEKHEKYLKEKKDYEQRMKTKRDRLLKQFGTSALKSPVGAGSGSSPKTKRRKKAAKTDVPKKKKSEPKKAAGAKKKSQPKKKAAAAPKKKSQPKKKAVSAPKKKKSQPKAAKKKSPKKKSPKKAVTKKSQPKSKKKKVSKDKKKKSGSRIRKAVKAKGAKARGSSKK